MRTNICTQEHVCLNWVWSLSVHNKYLCIQEKKSEYLVIVQSMFSLGPNGPVYIAPLIKERPNSK
jgi:hypothetical protein